MAMFQSGGITSGFPVRPQPPPTSTQSSYGSQSRHSYQGPPPTTRYY